MFIEILLVGTLLLEINIVIPINMLKIKINELKIIEDCRVMNGYTYSHENVRFSLFNIRIKTEKIMCNFFFCFS
jgi:predicted membrane-bound dolichyl-phosphate-mannose-protein mannosyltransferase